ncbi:MAG TPA: hypothetical protein VGB26_13385 [Nitrospiria bacterium]|jgi:hypothetical protein
MKQGKQALWKEWVMAGLMAVTFFSVFLGSAQAEMGEMEKYIRAQIEIGEGMFKFMREQSGKERSMELMEQWEKDINAMVAEILSSYDLTIDEYNTRKKEVLGNETEVKTFLDKHPELKEKYYTLPFHGGRGGGGGPH